MKDQLVDGQSKQMTSPFTVVVGGNLDLAVNWPCSISVPILHIKVHVFTTKYIITIIFMIIVIK